MSPEIDSSVAEQRGGFFQSRLKTILSPAVTAPSLGSIADTALEELTVFAGEIHDAYKSEVGYDGAEELPKKELEDAACRHYGLDSIDTMLDHVAKKSEQIKDIQRFVAGIIPSDVLITPPDDLDHTITEGNGGFEDKIHIPRLELLLYILQTDYKVNPGDLLITKGIVTKEMMRKEPYVTVEVTQLNKTIQVCDEEGNISFIFDSAIANQLGLSTDDLNDMTKQEKKALIDEHPEVGSTVRYSETWRQDVSELLNPKTDFTRINNPGAQIDPAPEATPDMPHAITDELDPLRGFYKNEKGVLYGRLEDIAILLGKPLEEVQAATKKIKSSNHTASISISCIDVSGNPEIYYRVFSIESTFIKQHPANIANIDNMVSSLGLGRKSIEKIIKWLAEEGYPLGETSRYKFGSTITTGYDEEQQALIAAAADYLGTRTCQAPPGVKSLANLAKHLGVQFKTAKRTIDWLKIEGYPIGEPKKYTFNNTRAFGYDEEQQALIAAALDYLGYFNDPEDESGEIINTFQFAKQLGVTSQTIINAANWLIEEGYDLGEVRRYKFNARTTKGYDEEQQALIAAAIDYLGIFHEQATEEVISITRFARMLGLSAVTIKNTVRWLQEEGYALGEVKQYKFITTISYGYDEEQQALIIAALDFKGAFLQKPAEGILSASGLALALGISHSSVRDAIKWLDVEGFNLGEIKEYKFKPHLSKGYDEEQQSMIAAALDYLGYLNPPTPKGVISHRAFARTLNTSCGTLQKTIDWIYKEGYDLGVIKKFRFNNNSAEGYDEDQQSIIAAALYELGYLKPQE